jgi:hypothetical protein
MEDYVYGVFYSDGANTYLVAAFDTEREAKDEAQRRAEEAFDAALDRLDTLDREPELEDFLDVFEVEPVERDQVDFDALERNIAQRF